MALPRFLAALAWVVFTSGPLLADELDAIRQQHQAGNLAGALDQTERYLATHPQNTRARFLKGLLLTDQGKTDEAVGVFTALTEDYPELPEPYNNIATIYAAQGRYELALDALETAIRVFPGYATAHENLGDIHAKIAAVAYEKALSLDGKNATAQTKLTLMRTLLERQALDPVRAPSLKNGAPSAGKGGKAR
jgi:tetratricopeptide (TPR) repeat protein